MFGESILISYRNTEQCQVNCESDVEVLNENNENVTEEFDAEFRVLFIPYGDLQKWAEEKQMEEAKPESKV